MSNFWAALFKTRYSSLKQVVAVLLNETFCLDALVFVIVLVDDELGVLVINFWCVANNSFLWNCLFSLVLSAVNMREQLPNVYSKIWSNLKLQTPMVIKKGHQGHHLGLGRCFVIYNAEKLELSECINLELSLV